MFKLTNKTTVETMKGMLNANYVKVKSADKSLADQIMYASKHGDKATKKDLYDLTKQVVALLGDKLVVPALAEEKSTKEEPKKTKKAEVKSEQALKPKAKKKAEEVAEKKSEEKAEEKPKKSLKSKKKVEEAESEPKEKPTKKEPKKKAEIFPSELTVGEESFTLADDIENMDDLYEALNDEQDIVLAMYWSKELLKGNSYYNNWLGKPKSFENDLDLTNVIYISDEKKIAYAVSMYTEAAYGILPKDLQKKKDGTRVSKTLKFQVYRKA